MSDHEPTVEPDVPAADETGPAPEPPLTAGLEALLFLAEEPLDATTLAAALHAQVDEVERACQQLAEDYERDGRGIAVRASAGGWRMYTAPVAAPVVERWALTGRSGRLTQAALETLAVIAYKQPISRQEISDIRGVNADGAVRSLVARGLVAEVGRDSGPGQAFHYGTTTTFLERIGLDSLDELPPLTEFLPEAPAPDEPELGSLKEVRRRLASGEDLPSRRLGGRSDAEVNTGTSQQPEPEPEPKDEDLLPPPANAPGRREGDEQGFDDLTERLDAAARSAVGQLRAAMAATTADDASQDDASDVADEPAADAQAEAGSGDGPETSDDGEAGSGDEPEASDPTEAETGDGAEASEPTEAETGDGAEASDPTEAETGDGAEAGQAAEDGRHGG